MARKMKMWMYKDLPLNLKNPSKKKTWAWHMRLLENFAMDIHVEEQCLRWLSYIFLKDLTKRDCPSGQCYRTLALECSGT